MESGRNTYRGCRLAIPNFEASVPARKGITAEPIWLIPPIIPTVPETSQGGTSRSAVVIITGYSGVSIKPTNETAIESPIKEGMAQTSASNLEQGVSSKQNMGATSYSYAIQRNR